MPCSLASCATARATHGQSIYKNLKEAALHKIDEAYPA